MAKDPTRVASGRKSRNKGSRTEREVAKIFSEWWGADFVRTPMSGGWGKHKSFQGKFGTSGDLVCPEGFPYLIESKSEEGWHLEQLLTSPDLCQTIKHWEQTVGETPEGKIPLLVFKRNFQPWFAAFQEDAVTEDLRTTGSPILCLRTSKYNLTITLLSNLTAIPKQRILELVGTPKG